MADFMRRRSPRSPSYSACLLLMLLCLAACFLTAAIAEEVPAAPTVGAGEVEELKRQLEALRKTIETFQQQSVEAPVVTPEGPGNPEEDKTKAEAEAQLEVARLKEEERQRQEAEQKEAERKRLEAERAEAEKLEAERKRVEAEAARQEAEKAEAERKRLEAERAEAEKLEAERKRVEAEIARLQAEMAAADRQREESEKQEAERRRQEAEKVEAERQRLEAEKVETERQRVVAERKEAEKIRAAEREEDRMHGKEEQKLDPFSRELLGAMSDKQKEERRRRLRAERKRKAEEKRLEEERQRIEAERQEAERLRVEAEKAEAERQRLEEERRRREDEQREMERLRVEAERAESERQRLLLEEERRRLQEELERAKDAAELESLTSFESRVNALVSTVVEVIGGRTEGTMSRLQLTEKVMPLLDAAQSVEAAAVEVMALHWRRLSQEQQSMVRSVALEAAGTNSLLEGFLGALTTAPDGKSSMEVLSEVRTRRAMSACETCPVLAEQPSSGEASARESAVVPKATMWDVAIGGLITAAAAILRVILWLRQGGDGAAGTDVGNKERLSPSPARVEPSRSSEFNPPTALTQRAAVPGQPLAGPRPQGSPPSFPPSALPPPNRLPTGGAGAPGAPQVPQPRTALQGQQRPMGLLPHGSTPAAPQPATASPSRLPPGGMRLATSPSPNARPPPPQPTAMEDEDGLQNMALSRWA